MNPKQVTELFVWKGSERIGVLRRRIGGSELTYDPAAVDSLRLPGVAWAMPPRLEPYTWSGDNLPPFFAGLLPEGKRFDAAVSRIKTSPDDLFSLLAALGGHTIGDIWTTWKPDGAPETEPILSPEDTFRSLAREQDEGDGGGIVEALAGVQPKVSGRRVTLLVRSKHASILKLTPERFPHLARNEHDCLRAAKAARLNVASSRLVKDAEGEEALLVRRFDRVGETMLHQEDALQIMNRYPEDKYRVSMREVIESALEISHSRVSDAAGAVSAYAMSYLIGNADLHAKNLSWIVGEDRRASFAPLYDLVCTLVYPGLDERMALPIDGKDDGFRASDIITFARRFDVPEPLMMRRLAAMRRPAALLADRIDEEKLWPKSGHAAAVLRRRQEKFFQGLSG
jgi:serine/threonine-protein kinase HipA